MKSSSRLIKYAAMLAAAVILIIAIYYYKSSHNSSVKQDTLVEIKNVMQERVAEGFSAGMAFAYIDGDDVTYILEGHTDIGDTTEVTQKTLFELGSVTKTFTGSLLSQAVARGLISMEDEADKYLPEGIKLPTFNNATIKIKHLATHTSGLAHFPSSLEIQDPEDPYSGYTAETFFQSLKNKKEQLLFEPGKDWQYSNTGVALIGYILSEVTGKRYTDLIQEEIFNTLGMNDTTFKITPRQLPSFSDGHAADTTVKHWTLDNFFYPTGGIITTIEDMVKYAKANISDQASSDPTSIYAAIKMAHKPVLSLGDIKIGTCWRIEGEDLFTHSGGTGGFSTRLAVMPKAKKAAIILNNSSYRQDDFVDKALNDKLQLVSALEDYEESFIGYYNLDSIALFGIAKVYIDDKEDLRIDIGFSDTKLYMSAVNTYFSKAINGYFRFVEQSEDRHIMEYILDMPDGSQTVEKAELLPATDPVVQKFISVTE